jgi:hypothetical protein
MKIINLSDYDANTGSGLFIGVSKSNTIRSTGWTGESSICIYNCSGTSLHDESVKELAKYDAKSGDVLGVVVDATKDQVRFYKNAKIIVVSTRKPSEMAPMYAVAWLYYQNCEVEMGNFYPYQLLEPYYEN